MRFPIEFGFAHTVDTETPTGVNAQKPLVQAEIVQHRSSGVLRLRRTRSSRSSTRQGSQVFRVGVADQGNVLARYVGGDASVLSGLMIGADDTAQPRVRGRRARRRYNGKGRVIMFANNPIYRWQNHGEFNMVFNSILNWNDVVK